MRATNVFFMEQMMVVAGGLALFLVVPLWLAYKRYLNLKGPAMAMLVLASLVTMVGTIAYRANAAAPVGSGPAIEVRLAVIGAGLFWVFLLPFGLRLYFTWMEGAVTEAEQLAGAEGIRAWLRGGNAVCALGITFFAWLGFGYSPWAVLFLCMAALLAYPVVNLLNKRPERPTNRNEIGTMSTERGKVLAMVDNGRITAEEAADLMNALGQTVFRNEKGGAPLDAARKLLLAGGALVLIGFFLPWFSVNLGEEMERLMGRQEAFEQMAQQFQQPMGSYQGTPIGFPASSIQTGTLRVMGGDIRHGLGWVILGIGMGVAVLPLMRMDLEAEFIRKMSLFAMGGGAILILYLLTQNLRFVSVGLIVVLIGYAIEAWSLLRTDPLVVRSDL